MLVHDVKTIKAPLMGILPYARSGCVRFIVHRMDPRVGSIAQMDPSNVVV